MANFRLNLAFLALLASLAHSSAQPRYLAQPESIADSRYAHPSGMVFPATVGDFHRVSLLRYDADGLDISAGYDLIARTGGVAATVYVSPGAAAGVGSCRGEFDAMKQAIVTAHASVKLLEERSVSLLQGGASHDGRTASFTYDETGGGAHRTLQSELYVFCGVAGKWAIEYRFSYPQGFDAAADNAAFMRNLRWTAPKP
jgi:hypothetical protein